MQNVEENIGTPKFRHFRHFLKIGNFKNFITLAIPEINPYLLHFGIIQERHLWKKIQNLFFDL